MLVSPEITVTHGIKLKGTAEDKVAEKYGTHVLFLVSW
jgi:hypothetical protein